MLNKQRVLGKYGMMPVQVKASFWFLVCTVLQRSISIVTTPIYTRMLNTYEYGQYGIFTSWKGLLSCFITLQIFSSVYMQAIIKHENERDKYTSAMEGLTLVMVVTWLGFYLITRVVWNEKIGLNTPQIIAMFIVIWGNAVFEFWSTAQRVDYKYRGLLIVTLAMALVQPVLCIFFIKFFTNKVTGLVWGIAASTYRQLLTISILSSKGIKACFPLYETSLSTVTPTISLSHIPFAFFRRFKCPMWNRS